MANTKLYVGNLNYDTTKEKLEEVFSKAGKVVDANVITDKYTGRSKGFAFVEMATEEEAQKAVSEVNDAEIDGRNVKVDEARPRKPR